VWLAVPAAEAALDTSAWVLRRAGYRVLAAGNGREALDVWEAARASGDPIRALVTAFLEKPFAAADLLGRPAAVLTETGLAGTGAP
jgi:CheY-like chemotaxis protein